MLQKTFEITTGDEAARVADTLRSIPEAAAAGETLLQAFVYGFSYEETAELLRPIREAFPALIVTGLSMFAAKPPTTGFDAIIFDEQPVLRLSFFFFASSRIRLLG